MIHVVVAATSPCWVPASAPSGNGKCVKAPGLPQLTSATVPQLQAAREAGDQ